ncbi:MAG: integrase [Sulfolobales archaeon]
MFRHCVQYIYFRRKIPLETFGWLMEVVPSRGYRAGVRVFEIDLELFEKTLKYLRERHYLYYLLMYYSGIRLEHVVKLVATFKPKEIVYIPTLDREVLRLVCFEKFCRYYLGLTGGKPREFVYFPKELPDPLSEHAGEFRDSAVVSKYFTRHDLLPGPLITPTSRPMVLSFWKCSLTEVLATSLHVTHSPEAILLSKNIICSLIAGDLRCFPTYSATLGGIPLPILSLLL